MSTVLVVEYTILQKYHRDEEWIHPNSNPLQFYPLQPPCFLSILT